MLIAVVVVVVEEVSSGFETPGNTLMAVDVAEEGSIFVLPWLEDDEWKEAAVDVEDGIKARVLHVVNVKKRKLKVAVVFMIVIRPSHVVVMNKKKEVYDCFYPSEQSPE